MVHISQMLMVWLLCKFLASNIYWEGRYMLRYYHLQVRGKILALGWIREDKKNHTIEI